MPEADPSAPVTGAESPHPALRATLPAKRGGEPFFYGGQAVIEGGMMRGKRHYAGPVRLPSTKEIVVDRGGVKTRIYVQPFWKLPFVPGLPVIGEQPHLGVEALMLG